MGLIRILPPGLVNRIAAGECVERPASVVKELAENALDAGATRIDVSILDGGRELIRVRDDGVGMDAEDLPLAVHPHATSKIRSDDDLFDIHTMGFRGEALASIGSVSRLMVTSRTRESDVAQTIRVEAGQASAPTPCNAPAGTTVEVRDLFYCVPARRKFLRTNQTEMGHISEQFARLALAHPSVAFSLRHQERVFHQLAAAGDTLQRIAAVFGPELSSVLIPIRRESDGVRVSGFVAPPAESRSTARWDYVFVNGRYVRDRFVAHAVREAYRSLIDPSRYPVTFIFISIDPAQVDVNVHPTKTEVRWRDSNYIHAQVLAALRDKFLSTNLDHRLRPPAEDGAYRERVRQAMVAFFTRGGGAGEGPRERGIEGTRERGSEGARERGIEGTRERGSEGAKERGIEGTRERGSEGAKERGIEGTREEGASRLIADPTALPAGEAPSLLRHAVTASRRPAIQVHNTYLVVETPDGVMIIDQHALHERVLYEELRRRIAERPLESQRLLIPEVLRVPDDRVEGLESHAEMLARLGIELTPAGPQSVALHAFPSLLLERVNLAEFVRDLLDLLAERGARPAADTLMHDVLDMMACKAAVKAGDALTAEEIAALLGRREVAERSSHCPHGRPTTLHLSLRELEKQFRRR
jgi:DNA mismatch repair protein MutL